MNIHYSHDLKSKHRSYTHTVLTSLEVLPKQVQKYLVSNKPYHIKTSEVNSFPVTCTFAIEWFLYDTSFNIKELLNILQKVVLKSSIFVIGVFLLKPQFTFCIFFLSKCSTHTLKTNKLNKKN